MKKFIIGFFRNFPTCTGLLLLLISCHFVGIKDFTESWAKAPEIFWDIVVIYLIIVYSFMQWILPDIEEKKRESSTWTMIFTSVTALVVLAKFFAP